ncbi:DUF4416 family protein [Planctomycetota bacterium]
MGTPGQYEPALLFAALFTPEQSLLSQGVSSLAEHFGVPESASGLFEFDETDYYSEEMGTGLYKELYLFPGIVNPGEIADIKLCTNSLETEYSEEGKRKLNIDPGYITLTKVVLATTKNYSHRIYIGKGIYCEITLSWHKGSFMPNSWTYPDYKRVQVIDFLNDSRTKLKTEIS